MGVQLWYTVDMALTPSQKFLVFWLIFLVGLAIGSKYQLPLMTLGWLTGLWLLVFVSGQQEQIELLSLALFAVGLGMIVWQITGGETWLKLGFIGSLSEALLRLRDLLIDRIFLALPEPHGSLLTGIIFGNRLKLDRELLETFRVVGLSHLIAVSGYNLTVLTANTNTLLAGLIGRRSLIASLGVILFFVIITGAPASILRAAVMASVVIVAQLIGRPARSMNLLIFAAGLLAIFEPKIIFEIGFQLSVVATYGLVRLSPLLASSIANWPFPKSLQVIIAETLAATLLTAPLLVAYFERLSVVSPITNILVLPLIPLLMGLGLVSIVVILLLPVIGKFVVLLTWPILAWIIQVGNWFAALPWAATEASLYGWVALGLMATVVAGVELLNRLFGRDKLDYLEVLMAGGKQ